MKKLLFSPVVVSILMLVFLAACSATAGLDATNWKLESYADAAGEMMDVLPKSAATLNFQAAQVSGNASCNNFSGNYQTNGSKIEFGPMAATRKMCAQPLGIMEQEDAYLAALGSTAEYNLRGNTLELKDDQGDVILIFTQATGE
jgi:heat shock protein HslJ